MKNKYVKPISRNIGSALPNAEGFCWNGASAKSGNGAAADCGNGSVALPSVCVGGPGPVGCNTGGTASSSCGVGGGVNPNL